MEVGQDKILIIDFGSQYTQLLARRVREVGVYSEIVSCDISHEFIQNFNPNGIILSGGPESVTKETALSAPQIIFELGCPILGICYGMQVMTSQLGGQVENATQHEYGQASITFVKNSKLFEGIKTLSVWMSHGDKVTELPKDFETIATTNSSIAAMANVKKNYYGLQFHPEVTHTEQGKRILERFVVDICNCKPTWQSEQIIENSINEIRAKVKKDKVILGLSGGVDSAVVAALLQQAIGEQLICVLVDTGLLRLNEVEEIEQTFAKHQGINLITVDAKQLFFDKLKGISDPEQKRKVIGHLFVEVFAEQSKKISEVKWLAQGTIYPDVIESAAAKTNKAHVIKSHHNVAGLPEKLPFKLIEPLRELFKDEVRKIGEKLGLPHKMVYRHPFPGPGLAVRILGEVQSKYIKILQQADAIFIEELINHDLYYKIAQAFAVFLPVKTVAVKGDARKYEYVIALRAVATDDFMTAKCVDLPHEILTKIANRICNEVPQVSRVVYDISSKPPATIEWE
jgi:GMP synthase (glutamine-hydrolysing)